MRQLIDTYKGEVIYYCYIMRSYYTDSVENPFDTIQDVRQWIDYMSLEPNPFVEAGIFTYSEICLN